MYTPNQTMISAGFRPAKDVAEVIEKTVSTVHRMASTNRVKSARDGRALYIEVRSLIGYYEESGNPTMAKAIKKAFGSSGESCGSK